MLDDKKTYHQCNNCGACFQGEEALDDNIQHSKKCSKDRPFLDDDNAKDYLESWSD